MESFGIVGMSPDSLGFIFALSALTRVAALEKKLKKLNVLKDDAVSN